MKADSIDMLLRWIRTHNGDTEAVALWMARTLHVGSLPACRAMLREAEAAVPDHMHICANLDRIEAIAARAEVK